MSLVIASLGLASLACAAEAPPFVSKTFQEIQSRVVRRDAQCGAILDVKVREDAPRLGFGLHFSIEEVPYAGEAVVVLSRNLKGGDGVYEKYRLRIDAAIRQELTNQKRLKELEAERLRRGGGAVPAPGAAAPAPPSAPKIGNPAR